MSLIVDLFAGGGGASVGIRAAIGRDPDVAINHWGTALEVHRANHPGTRHLEADLWEVRPSEVTEGRPVSLLWASPDCSHHSIAKGGVPRENKLRGLAWVVVEWARAVRPAVIFVENVREFASWGPLDDSGHINRARTGETFCEWIRALRELGYQTDYGTLDASDFGAPTRRRRLFIVARADGAPIRWPVPTHGPGRIPYRTAAQCIDWSIPCPSIFERERPLAEKTLWRIAQGLRRFVFEAADPFIIQVNHGKREARGESVRAPLSVITASRRGHGLVVPSLVQTGYGERQGQRARTLDVRAPLGTCVSGQKHGLVAAFLAKHFGDPLRASGGGRVVGTELDAPLGTVTARDHHSLVTSTLCKLRGECHSSDPAEPLPTVTAKGTHLGEVRAFLTAYYGSDGTGGQMVLEPMRTLTARHRLGLVTVEGVDFQIVDIGFRMLQPEELLRAQFGAFADGYDLSAAKTKEARVRLIGNSVCPEVARALVAANLPPARTEAA